MSEDKTLGCDDCIYLKGGRCRLWQVKVSDPHNSHCETVGYGAQKKKEVASDGDSYARRNSGNQEAIEFGGD